MIQPLFVLSIFLFKPSSLFLISFERISLLCNRVLFIALSLLEDRYGVGVSSPMSNSLWFLLP